MRRRYVIDNWDFTANTARKGHKRLVPKLSLCIHVQREMFVKMSLRERLFMLEDFVGMNLRILLLPPPSYFLNVSLPTLVTADFKDFFPLITSVISGTA